jgi:hypothetical protein
VELLPKPPFLLPKRISTKVLFVSLAQKEKGKLLSLSVFLESNDRRASLRGLLNVKVTPRKSDDDDDGDDDEDE